ncbi:uncharacterized protein LOC134836315 [Culicoides brevitarsis]|uniref:uncharacterized protein LOC134836315 n=1 Tax=Culicoides brevitarsis TaxID=469753 RepID=UPI00307BC6AD
MSVAAVAIKLPEFWEEDPETWFIEAESQFTLANVVLDATKYHHIVKHITSKSTINVVWDIISNPPAQNKYEAIKQRLTSVFGSTLQTRVERLFSSQIGEMKPSQYLFHLKRLSFNTGLTDDALKTIFLKGLPSHMSSVLAIINQPLSEIAQYGDVMIKNEPVVNEVSQRDEKYEQLQQQIEHLTAAVKNLKPYHKNKPFVRPSNRSSSSDICWYHSEYGKNARKCNRPCRFSKN